MKENQLTGMEFIIVGAGNVAVHMAVAIKNAGLRIKQVYSRTTRAAEELASQLSVDYTNDIGQIDKDGDVYLFMLADDALEEILEQIELDEKIFIHTSGSTGMDILKKYSDRYGVIYPLQTFNKHIALDFENVPLFIEASDNKTLSLINTVTNKLSRSVTYANSVQRSYLHVAAVFACNFSNHMYTIAEKLLKENNISFEVLMPLIKETTRKAIEHGPSHVQTGPAMRNDKNILNFHQDMLGNQQDIQTIYSYISEHIFNYYHNAGNEF